MNWNGKKMQTSKTAVALGFFDGVHIGHMSLINKIKELEADGLKSCVYTFDKHPSKIFGTRMPLILSFEDKIKELKETGVNAVYVQETDKEFLSLSPEEFVQKVLIEKLSAAHVVAGENFTFGKNKSGNAEMLKKLCAENDIECTIMPYKTIGETVVSSTEIRKMITEGDIRSANEYLGRRYGYSGVVKPGTQIGVKLGYPTANITPDENIILTPNGVYASLAVIDGKTYKAITNIGIAPTFDKTKMLIETNILDFDGDIYNKEIRIFLVDMIRQEQKFASSDELSLQIAKDIEKRRNLDE